MVEPAERPIPPAILIGGGLVMAVSLMLVTSTRVGLSPRQARPAAVSVEALDFRVRPEARGQEGVYAARDGRRVATLAARGDDFLPSLVDKLRQERSLRRVAGDAPFRLVRWSDGRVSLQDPTTGRELNLEAFGSVNEANAADIIAAGRPDVSGKSASPKDRGTAP